MYCSTVCGRPTSPKGSEPAAWGGEFAGLRWWLRSAYGGENSGPRTHLQHHRDFFGRQGHAPGDLGLRQLPAVRWPAGVGGDIRLLRLGAFPALLLGRWRGRTAVVVPAGGAVVAPLAGVAIGCGLAHGSYPLLFRKQRAASRGRVSGGDGGGKQASRGPGCTEPESFTEAEEAGRKPVWGREGAKPLGPRQAASAAKERLLARGIVTRQRGDAALQAAPGAQRVEPGPALRGDAPR